MGALLKKGGIDAKCEHGNRIGISFDVRAAGGLRNGRPVLEAGNSAAAIVDAANADEVIELTRRQYR